MDRITGLPALLLDRRLRRSFLCSLVLVIGIVIAPLSSQSASALEHQRNAPACNAAADAVAGASKSGQLITVVSPTSRSQNATLEFLVRRGGCFRLADGCLLYTSRCV